MNDTNADLKKFQFFYQHLSDDIEYAKRRQWSIPYYILLLFAAIIGIHKAGVGFSGITFLLPILASIISLFGVWHVFDVHFVQAKYRKQLHNLDNQKPEFVYHYLRPDKDDLKTYYYFLQFTVFFWGIIVTGLAFILLYFDVDLFVVALNICLYAIYGCLLYIKRATKLKNDTPLLTARQINKS